MKVLVGGPWRHHLLAMVSCVVCGKSISCSEVFVADNTIVGHVKVDFSVSFNLGLVPHLKATSLTSIFGGSSFTALYNHTLQEQVQI